MMSVYRAINCVTQLKPNLFSYELARTADTRTYKMHAGKSEPNKTKKQENSQMSSVAQSLLSSTKFIIHKYGTDDFQKERPVIVEMVLEMASLVIPSVLKRNGKKFVKI